MRRNIQLLIRLTEAERNLLSELAENDADTKTKKNPKKNLSAYIRKRIFSGSNRPSDFKQELKNLNYQVRKIGVNINQVTAKVNSSYVTPEDLQHLNTHLQEVEEAYWEMIRKMEVTYGYDENFEYWDT